MSQLLITRDAAHPKLVAVSELPLNPSPPPLVVDGRWKKHEKFWRATAEALAELERRPFRTRRQVAGRYGERLAEDYFVNTLGAKLLERNFRVTYGEIDLLFDHEDVLVAVEVKARDVHDMAHPLEVLSARQVRSIERTLMTYAQDNDMLERSMRIDLVAIQFAEDGTMLSLEHVPNVYPG